MSDKYDKLAPIVIQGSYHLSNKTLNEDFNKFAQRRVTELLFSDASYFICTAFESSNEVLMKNYLLKHNKRIELCKGNIWLISSKGLRECWRFIKDKYFLCLHFIYDTSLILRSIN